MRQLTVALGQRSYPILIGPGLLGDPDRLQGVLRSRKVAVVSNETVAPLYLTALLASLGPETQAVQIVLPDGEQYKTWESLNAIHDAMLAAHCDRATTVIALGGGVVGDLAGFAAATYQRGVDFIQIPTTLLAQVDSSVGGKTGINHPRGKNMVGAFWQPRLVLADTGTLKTLPPRELSAGLAEVIKYGLLGDARFLAWIEDHIDALLVGDPETLGQAVERSCAMKAEVVAGDELETAAANGRALLNLGHTFGHAIEAGLGYGQWLHGEAVAAGMVMAAELSRRLGWLPESDVSRVRSLLEKARLPVAGPTLGASRYLELMAHDKKAQAGKLKLVLLRRLGQAVTWADAAEHDIRAAIEACCT